MSLRAVCDPSTVLGWAPGDQGRALNTVYQPNVSKGTLCAYSVKQQVSSLLLGSAECKCELLSDASNPPTTVRDTISIGTSGVLNIISSNTATVRHLVPAGHYIKLLTTTVGGTASQTLISQCETTCG